MQNIKVEGCMCILTEIDISDSRDICNLRNDPVISKYLSNISPVSVEDQETWILKNIGSKDGYYFKINDLKNNIFLGTISIYNINQESAEFGRYICTNPIHATEAEYLILNFGFEKMNLRRIFCRTADENKSVWNQHLKFGFKNIGYEYLESKNLNLIIQELTYKDYLEFDYSPIINLVSNFSTI